MGQGLRSLAIATLVVSVLGLTGPTADAQSDGRADYLVRLLRTSDAFRVRAQAALSLGSIGSNPRVVEALSGALRDDDPTVRAAAASSLERIGDPSAIASLRGIERDREPAVREAVSRALRSLERVARTSGSGRPIESGRSDPSGGTRGTPRFYIGVGIPGSRVSSIDSGALRNARTFIATRVSQMDGVVVAPESESSRQAQQVLRERSLSGFYLDSSIVSLGPSNGGTRAQVSVIVQSYPDRNVRSMLQGAATVVGESGPGAERAAIEAAIQSALSRLGTAIGAPQ